MTYLTTAINFIITAALGYCLSVIKNQNTKRKEKTEEEGLTKLALMTMLQTNLTNTYFAYEHMKAIPDYIYKNWLNELKVYESLGGNDYVHILAKKMESWEITHTDILNRG